MITPQRSRYTGRLRLEGREAKLNLLAPSIEEGRRCFRRKPVPNHPKSQDFNYNVGLVALRGSATREAWYEVVEARLALRNLYSCIPSVFGDTPGGGIACHELRSSS